MRRAFRPWTRLLTAASLLVAGVGVMVVAPTVMSPAAAVAEPSCGGPIGTGFTVGAGTAGDPYRVTNSAQLAALELSSGGAGKHYRLVCDLNLVADGYTNWTPIGVNNTQPFQGAFDGNGKTISNLNISSPNSYQGLFGYVRDATISGVTLQSVTIAATTGDYVGSLVGYVYATSLGAAITNITVSAANIVGDGEVGGAVGYIEMYRDARMTDVRVSDAHVTGRFSVGGALGEIYLDDDSFSFANVTVQADVTVSGGTAGGAIGATDGGDTTSNITVTDTHFTGTVTSVRSTTVNYPGRLGGLIGWVNHDDGAVTIEDSTSAGLVTGALGDPYVGGLVGEIYAVAGTVRLDQSPSSSDLTASGDPSSGSSTSQFVGGLVGGVEVDIDNSSPIDASVSITESSATGDVNAATSDNVAGLLGGIRVYTTSPAIATVTVSAAAASGAVAGFQTVGGLVGHVDDDDDTTINLDDVEYLGSNVTASDDVVGGLIGHLETSSGVRMSLTNATASGMVQGISEVGGVIGEVEPGDPALTFANITSTANVSASGTFIGGFVGQFYEGYSDMVLNISNVHVSGDVTASGADTATTSQYRGGYVGGFIGEWTVAGGVTTVEHSSASGTVTATRTATDTVRSVGGFVGNFEVAEGALELSHIASSGDVVRTGYASDVGGLIGNLYLSRDDVTTIDLHDVHSSGDVITPEADWVGGLIGSLDNSLSATDARADVTISASSASGAVTASSYVGGLVGWLRVYYDVSMTVVDSHYTAANASVAGEDEVGGLIGVAGPRFSPATLTLTRVTASARVTGDDGVGGLIGDASADDGATMSISRAVATGLVSGLDEAVGGLIGRVDTDRAGTFSISASSATGNVSGSAQSSIAVGGLIGEASEGGGTLVVDQSKATGRVSGNDELGGLIGHASASTGTITVSRSFSSGDVVNTGIGSNKEFGGLVAVIDITGNGSVTIEDVYATGAVSAGSGDQTGGLVGELLFTDPAGSVEINRTHAVGEVNGGVTGADVGGLIGKAPTGATVSASFWDTTTTKQTTSAGGEGKATGAMRNALTFSGAGWSISNGVADQTKTWAVCSSIGYPFLMWQTDLVAALPGAPSCPTDGSISGGSNNGSLPPAVGGLVTQPVPTSTTTVAPSSSTTLPPTTTAPSGDTVVPVPVDGVLPDLPAGDVLVVEDGEPVTVEVFVENDTELVVQSTRFELRLQGDCSTSSCTIETTPEGREVLTLEENGKANTQGEGFQPGSTVHVWLFSEPRYLGQLTVNADGTFEGDVDLGDIAVGEHTLQVNGTSQTGAERSANLGVIVNPQAVPTPGTGVLPATGTSTTPIWLVALALLGVGLVATSRRRNA